MLPIALQHTVQGENGDTGVIAVNSAYHDFTVLQYG